MLRKGEMRRGFTLIEMLIVIGIIVTLMAASIGGYSYATKQAQKARGRELVSNVSTALNALFQRQSYWPPRLLQEAKGQHQLTADAAVCLKSENLMALSATETRDAQGNRVYKLSGLDRCGIVDPWATDVLRRLPEGNSGLSEIVPSGGTVKDHILYFGLDEDGDGYTDATVGGVKIRVRANAIVWSAGMDGVEAPYPYAGGGHTGKGGQTRDSSRQGDDIYSWLPNQVVK